MRTGRTAWPRWSPLALAALPVLTACSLAGDVTPPPGIANVTAPAAAVPTITPQPLPDHPEFVPAAAAGASVYAAHCAACHGPQGAGNGPSASQLPNPPPDLSTPDLARENSPADWFAVVTQGNLDNFMPPFGQTLSETDRWNAVYYLYALSSPPDWIASGQESYAANCAGCHGDTGRGDGPDAASAAGPLPDLTDPAFAAPLAQADFVKAITGQLGDGSHVFAGGLTEDERWQLAAYLQTFHYAYAALAASVEPGQVAGLVSNGTAGAEVPAGLEVTLHGYEDLREVISMTAPVSADGSYLFEAVELVPRRTFVASVEYLGVVYTSQWVTVESDSGGLALPLAIYETTGEASAIRVAQAHVIFQFVDGGVQVGELMVFGNAGDRTYVGQDPQGRTLWVDLPAGATELSFESGRLGERFVQTPTGFADTLPLVPGVVSDQVLFSFQLPYTSGLDFEQPLRYPVDVADVLLPEAGVALRSDRFRDMGPQEVQAVRYLAYEATGLAEGEAIRFALAGRPGGAAAFELSPGLLIGLGVFILALAGVAYYWSRSMREAPAWAAAAQPQDFGGLIRAIAELDDAFEAGQVPEPEYRARRAHLKRAAVERAEGKMQKAEGNGQ